MRDPVRRIFLFAFIQLVFLSACGGGSSDLTGGSSSTGTGTGTGSGQTIASAAANVVSVSVDAGPSGVGSNTTFNIPYVSVTICPPGSTTNCETIDHIEVDTGSYGLRVIASAFTSSTVLNALPLETSIVGGALVECTQFGDGIAWGSMRTANVQISSETAANLPIQIIGDPNYPTIPSDCTTHGSPEDTVALFGANGILGVGPFVADCPSCASSTQGNVYFACPVGGGTCNDVEAPTTQQAANPVASFTTDNNGVILELPTVADAGAASATGALVFGIGTQSNNTLGSATVLTTDDVGNITITYKNVAYPDSFIDSGSNLIFLNDSSLTVCGTSPNQVFCPTSEQSVSAVNEGANNVQSTVSFKIGDASTLFNNNPSFTAFDNVAAPSSDSTGFDFGLPFFYGRNVFVAIQGATTSGGTGPYVAY
jgi:hypothetical protein